MSEIIDFPINEVQKDETSFLEDFINSVGAIDDNSFGGFEEIAMLMALPDEQFNVLSAVFLDTLEKSLSRPNEVAMLRQNFEATNIPIEALNAEFESISAQLDEQFSETISKSRIDFLKQIMSISLNAINGTLGAPNRIVKIPIEFCHKNAKMPAYAHVTDAGMDVYALEDITVNPGETKLIPLGIKVAIPTGYELQVRAKSGRALKTKLRVANAPGTIDAPYRGEVGVIIDNIDSPIKEIDSEPIWIDGKVDHLKINSILYGSSYTIGKGEKFAQLVLSEVPHATFYKVDNINEFESDRGDGGYGSSGLK